MTAEYHTNDRCQAHLLKNKLKKAPYLVYPMTYYDFRVKYGKLSLEAYDLYMVLLHLKTPSKGARYPYLTLMTMGAFNTPLVFRKARHLLHQEKIINFAAHAHNLQPGLYKILSPPPKNAPFILLPHDIKRVFYQLLVEKTLSRKAMHLYFYLFALSRKSSFPPSLLISPVAIQRALFLPSRTFWHCIDRLKSLRYLDLAPSPTQHHHSDLLLFVPMIDETTYSPRATQQPKELATQQHAEDVLAIIKNQLQEQEPKAV